MTIHRKAEIDENGIVHLLETIEVRRTTRAIVTILENDPAREWALTPEETILAEERLSEFNQG